MLVHPSIADIYCCSLLYCSGCLVSQVILLLSFWVFTFQEGYQGQELDTSRWHVSNTNSWYTAVTNNVILKRSLAFLGNVQCLCERGIVVGFYCPKCIVFTSSFQERLYFKPIFVWLNYLRCLLSAYLKIGNNWWNRYVKNLFVLGVLVEICGRV